MWSGSAFEFFRDKSMNALTETEKLRGIAGRRRAGQGRLPPEPVRRQLRRPDRQGQGALLLRHRAHQPGQDAGRSTPRGCSRRKDGIFAVPYRETPFTGKVTANLNAEPVPLGALRPRHQLAAVQRRAEQHVRQLGRQLEQVQLDQPEPQLGAGRIEAERVHLPVRRLRQHHRRRAARHPNQSFPNGVTTGANGNTPQTTQQRKFQFRDDFSWHKSGGAASATTSRSASTSSTSRTCSSPSTPARARCSTPTSPTTSTARSQLVTVSDGNAVGEHPDEAVRDLLPGRLARQRPLHAELRPPLRPDDRLSVRRVEEPELRRRPGGRRGRQARRHRRPRELRAGAAGRPQQLPAAHRRRLRRPRQRQGHHPRRLGHLHRRRLHQLERAVRGGRLDRRGLRPDVQRRR